MHDGDLIRVDLAARALDVLVDEAVLSERAADWKPHPPRYESGVLAKYARLVGSADNGAVTN